MRFLKNPFYRFLVVSTGMYLLWYFTYEYYLKPYTLFDQYLIDRLVVGAEGFMKLFGAEMTDYASADGVCRQHIGIAGSGGVTIGPPCDGAVLYALFACFIIAYPGPVKHKLWFAPIGMASVFFMNMLRVVALAVVVSINEEWLAFNHDYTFTIIVYSYVFLLWWIWVNRFAQTSEKEA